MTTQPINPTPDWAARLLGDLYRQHQLPNFQAMCVAVLAPQAQDLENAFQSLLGIVSIDDSEGVQLDVIGLIVNQQRQGLDDPTFRIALYARIQANRSSGTPEDLYRVFSLLTQGATGTLHYKQGGIASFSLLIDVPVLDSFVPILVEFIFDTKMAGVRAVLMWQEDVDANMFTFGDCVFLLSAASIGDTSINVSDTSDFPASGTITLDSGLFNAETVTFSVAPGGHTLTTTALTNAHAVHAAIEFVDDAGLGFGDSSNPATGGELAGAADAG